MELNELNINAFDFEELKKELGVDPFEENNNKYKRDERFYVLSKDKDGNGAALIRFLPDSEKRMIQKMYKINTTIVKNGKKRFVSLFSPSTIGLPCPFQEKWQELWNAGEKEEARKFSRSIRYISNIKVLKDPANPENEGKIFLYEMSGALKNKIQNAIDPSPQDRALGAKPKELFNPLRGNSFKLIAKRGSNGQINYDSSEVVNEVTSIYNSVEEALEDIKNNTYKLSDLLKPESFLPYDELKRKLEWVTFSDVKTVVTVPKNIPLKAEMAEPSNADSNEISEIQQADAVTKENTNNDSSSGSSGSSDSSSSSNKSLDELLNELV